MSGPYRLLLRQEVSGFYSGSTAWTADGTTRHEVCTVARRKERRGDPIVLQRSVGALRKGKRCRAETVNAPGSLLITTRRR